MVEKFRSFDIRGVGVTSSLNAIDGLHKELVQTKRRLQAANRSIWLKAAELADDPDAILMLTRLSEERKLLLEGLDLGRQEDVIALARLAGAQLCEVTKREVWVTPRGIDFYQRVQQSQTT